MTAYHQTTHDASCYAQHIWDCIPSLARKQTGQRWNSAGYIQTSLKSTE
jgi:hypothetical protein